MTLPLPVAGPAGPAALALDAAPLRILACGSVDDGKSTLIGRIIYDLGCVPEDQIAALERDSKRYGTAGGALDFALLLDGLEAEREQGITIDVAYRYFQSPRRAFIVADAPGHEQYTRNMATGASHCEVALILADARKGVLAQTRRHSCIASLLGIRHVVLAVNKMDLVGYDQAVFDRIVADYTAFVAPLGFGTIAAVPVSASKGDNVVRKSGSMAWYAGPALIEHLEATETSADAGDGGPLRFPVQWVNRPDQNFRGYAGTVAGGRVAVGDGIAVARSGMTARIARIVTMDGDLGAATAGAAVTLVLDREVDASRGDVLAAPDNRPEIADQFAAQLVWFGEEPLLVGRQYLLKTQNQTVPASVTTLKHRIEIEDLSPAAARTLAQNDIGVCNLSLSVPVAFDPYAQNRSTGSFILIDRFSNATVGAGMIQFGLRRATNIHVQKVDVDKAARALLKRQAPACLWFTGLSGAGKSTIANLVERQLLVLGHHTYLLDGDNVRHGLNRDLGFTQADRVENVRRVAEVTRLMLDAGLIVLVALISPYRAERQLARDLMAPGEFVEIHVDAPIALCRQRDPKGLYRKADEGLIKNFTGVDSAYEPPLAPELVLHSDQAPADALAEKVLAHLRAMKAI